ncbi:MAG: glycosyltransferase [Alphaproteobacteria bacterium]|nr:glycosyltransferase [Alphaproteobacteria bacterium]
MDVALPLPAEQIASLHRHRFVAPLCRDRAVRIDGAEDAEALAPVASVAASVQPLAVPGAAEVILSLAPQPGQTLATALPALRRRLAPGGVLMAAVSDGLDWIERALAAFVHVRRYRQRAIAGSVFVEEAYAIARIAGLADPPPPPPWDTTLILASDAPLPSLPSGIFEAAGGTVAAAATAPPPALEPDAAPADDLRGAASLIGRLIELDERSIDLAADATRLREQVERHLAAGGSTGGAFDVPRTPHAWPTADAPERDSAELTFYERRPDDEAIAEGRAGDAFLRQFALLGEQPDFAGAAAALNAMASRLARADKPDATIVIPVYGQLAYTLNCLHSLRAQRSRYSAEILIADDRSPDATATVLASLDGITLHTNPANLGFLHSCNAAAARARGRVLVLLNNDTRVLPGWLDALLDGLAQLPNAGLVGSKLLYPDGTLQEAGAIIWRDGSAWNFGRNDDPNRPHYCHARPVDYVSAAAVAIPRDLWCELGGFDARFAPAYCEDADLALRISAAGRTVWYQPTSRVIHYEGRTSGTDTASGVKAHQVANAAKLFLRWRDRLAQHRPNGEAPYFERDRAVRQRALIVDATTPTPKQDAGSVTTTQTLQLFAELDYKPYYMPQDNFLFEPEHTPALQAMGVECLYAPYEGPFDACIRRYGALFDVIFVYRFPVLEQTLDLLRRFAPQAPVLFHAMDLHFLRLEREAELDGSDATRAAAAQARTRELELIRRVDCAITHSTFERDLLAAEAPETPIVVWPFMFDFLGTDIGFDARRDFVFLGGYRHRPNVDAVQFFAAEVLPLIRAEIPEARFIIAGANPGPEVQELAGPHVVVTGMIDELRDVLDAARVFVCPLRIGAGTKGKISTAMSYGLPVVSTPCGAEGMEMVEGEEVLIAESAADLAAACVRLYRDPALWQRLSQAGQALVQEKHSLQMGRRTLASAIGTAWRRKLGIAG